MSERWDVIVAGSGPGGAMAALKCARGGLKTLLLEKRRMPRDKVCSGMVMGEWAQDILREEMGEIPADILASPPFLDGYAAHVPGTFPQLLDIVTPIAWRKKLDHWMNTRAQEAGAGFWDDTRVEDVLADDGAFRLAIKRDGRPQYLGADFIVGADGARSAVRGALFPELKPAYWHCYRECYGVRLDLPERRFNFFSTIETAPFYFCTHDKDDFMLMEGGAPVGKIKETVESSRRFLIENHGLDPDESPLWRDACVEPILYQELFTGEFRPAKGNILLVGDAAGLNMPVTGEGVGTALRSGRDAAIAIMSSSADGTPPDKLYLEIVEDYIRIFKDVYQFSRRIKSAASTGDPKTLSEALLAAWDHSLKAFQTPD